MPSQSGLTKTQGLTIMLFCYYCAERFVASHQANSLMNSDFPQDTGFPLSEQITRDYRILRLLGKGGMGEVYLAEQLRVGRRLIALKVLSNSFAASPEMAKRFENEASSAGRINHRNVVTVYESRITDDGQIYVAMEFVEGKSLTDILKERTHLPLNQVVKITRQICSGLAAAHKRGIVHRDIKPDNIMLMEEEGEQVVKLLDFGIARLSETDASAGQTRAGVIMGTPTYMSPEQAMGKTGDLIDARSDIYSVGMLVYQMLTGHLAFKAKTAMEMMRKHISEPPLPLQQWQTDEKISDAVEQVVLKALQKNRDLRQQSITEFANELEAAVKGVSPEAKVSQKDMPTVRITKEAPTMATAPLSSEKTSAGQIKAPSHKSQGLPPEANQSQLSLQQIINDAKQSSTKLPQQTDIHAQAETIKPQNKLAESLPGRSYKKELLVAALILLAIFSAVAVVIKISGTGNTAVSPTMNYRIKRETPSRELETLAMDNTIRTGEEFYFEMKLISQGALYVFGEQTEKNDGSWQWLKSSDTLSAGLWSRCPFGFSLKADEKPGLRKYLIVLVPAGATWSAAANLTARDFPTIKNVATIPPEVAALIQESLRKEAVEMNAVSVQQEKNVSYSLSKKGSANQTAFYEVSLNQTP
jgi:serine/threonine protein kinase